jgi:ubiquinone/menaquinone biosynthesis C-methylase UbiE
MAEWNQILNEKWYSQKEPDETVVNFVGLLKSESRKKRGLRVLDIGCGAGRHLIYMADQGLEAYGLDISEKGLDFTKERLKKRNLEAFIVKSDMNELPFINSCFDAVVCLHTIYHQKFKEIKDTVFEITRVLRKKGFLLINFLSKRTYSYGKGLKVEDDTFVEQEGVEKGVLHHFTDREEINHLFKDFKILNLSLKEKKVEGKLRGRWILVAMA